MAQALVTVCGQYVAADGSAPSGIVTFTPRVNGAPDSTELDILGNLSVVAVLDATGSFSVNLFPTDDPARTPSGWTYKVEESILGATRRTYDIVIPIAAAGGPCLELTALAPVPPSTGLVYPFLGMPPQTLLNVVPGSYVYAIPSNATMVTIECLAGGAGGASGATWNVGTSSVQFTGGGGGGGGGRTIKTFPAAGLRAAFPTGIPYTVAAAGVGGAATTGAIGNPGTAGGFTFAADLIVAIGGGAFGAARGGGQLGAATNGAGGVNGTGDTIGGFGGYGGALNGASGAFLALTGVASGAGGFVPQYSGGGLFLQITLVQGGGAGGGGGGGAVAYNGTVGSAGNGGNSGIQFTVNVTPAFGSGGIAGGALPTTGGAPSIPGVASQGGAGGGGAGSVVSNAQNGANALAGSGCGGGGGGSCFTPGRIAGAGGNGGSGFIRFVAV